MSTTTIRMPDDLKRRVEAAASRAGTSTQRFMLEAIAEKTEQQALRADFEDGANARYAAIVESGQTLPWNEMRDYLTERVAGRKTVRPLTRKLTP